MPETNTEPNTIRAFTYIAECSDGSLYTGWTLDLEGRLKAHNDGTGAKYTRTRRPVKLVYSEEFDTRAKACQRECQIKELKRKEKLKLINRLT
jgi:putative endonuclease